MPFPKVATGLCYSDSKSATTRPPPDQRRERLMTDPRVARQSNDIILKRVAQALGGHLFQRFGLPFAPIVASLPTDQPVLEVREQATDLLFRLEDTAAVDLEFQTTQRPDDLLRFASYNLEAYRRYRVPIHTVVLYGAGITSAPDTLVMGALTFTVTSIFLGREDGDAVLARLRAVAAQGDALTPGDRVDLILLPLMRQTRPLEQVLAEAIATTETLPPEERAETGGAMAGLAYTYLDKDVAVALLEALKMRNALREWLEQEIGQGIEQGIEQGKAQGIEQGKMEGERAALRLVVRSRFGAVPPALEQRSGQADSVTIERLLARAATATAIEAL